MLYDCRSDSFCSDVSLWDNSTIAFMRQSLPRPLTEVKCIEGDSLQDRFRALDVTTPLRASVLSGLVEVGGAAGYLNHPVQSTLQDRVTLQYRTTTRLDMLSHRVLQEETDRTQRKATHVVMAVLYGAQAFFIFDSKHISGQHSGAGEADMHRVVKKMMPTFSADQIFSSLSDTEKLNSSLYQCTLYCDVDHINGSMTYDRALQVYETLPKHLGQEGEKAVPLYAWLYPLKNLGHSVEILFFTKAEGVLDHLRQATMRCQEIMTDSTNGCVMKWFPDLTYKLSRLSELLQKYQSEFKRELAMAVKTMRESEGVDENRLRDILQNHDQSPFCPQSVPLWLNNKAAEVKALNVCKTRNIPIMKSQEELDGVLRSSNDRLLCFTLTSLEDKDPFLSTMEQHKLSVQENTMNQSDLTGQQETQRPFKPPDLTQKLKSDLRLFTKSYEDSRDGENIKFIAAVIPDISVPGSSIRLYQQGSLITTNFLLGLKPDPVQVAERKQSCVLLTFPQSTIRRPERYRVEYRVMTTSFMKVSKRPWNEVVTLAPAETCVVAGLKPFTLYQIRYSVIEHSGMSDFSKVIEVKTLRSPPEHLYVSRLLNKTMETIKVTWFQPESEDGASVLHYKVDYKEAGLEGWSTMVTEGPECKCIISLNLSTCYRVRVSAVYGEGEGDTSETSRETDVPVNVWYIDLSERKASLLLEVQKLQPEKKPVELKGWSDEESEVRSFLQCLSYISQLSFYPRRSDPSKQIKFLVDLLSQAAEWEEQTGEKTLKLVSSVWTYNTFPFPNGDNSEQSDFLLDLYSHVKDYETQTGRSVLPALQPVYQSAPAVWSINLSERKASLLLEVLKLQPEKKPVELKGWSDEESEVRSFLQYLPYISQLSFCPWRSDPSKQIKFLVDLLSQAAEWEEQTGEKTLKLVSSVWTYSTFPFPNRNNSERSDFLLDLYSHVKDYETQTGRSVLPALQPVYQSAPAVLFIYLSERKASLLLEVLKLQPEKKPVELKGWSDVESEVRSFLQCLPYISQLR
uniref:Fibronectin type-III domain-containing protein n=1 Tax=Salmo trutta TaxID=8032 RepID=A0A674DG73_SALTR